MISVQNLRQQLSGNNRGVKSLEYQLEKGKLLYNEGKYLHALQIYQTLLTQYNFDKVVFYRLIQIYEKLNRANAILRLAENYNEEIINDEDLFNAIISVLIRNSLFEEASGIIDKGPDSQLRKYFKGLIGFTQSDFQMSILNFNDFIKTKKSSELVPEALYYLAESYFFLKEYDHSYQKALEAKYFLPDDDRIIILLAENCFELGMLQNASGYLGKVSNKDNGRYNLVAAKVSMKNSKS